LEHDFHVPLAQGLHRAHQPIEGAWNPSQGFVSLGAGAVQTDFQFKRVDLVLESLGHGLIDEEGVGVDPNGEMQSLGLFRDLEEILSAKRLAAREGKEQNAKIRNLPECLEDLPGVELFLPGGTVVAE